MARGREATAGSGAAAGSKAGAEGRKQGGAGERSETAPESAEARVTEAAQGGAASPLMDLEFVRALIEAVDSSGIDSLELTRAGTRVKISKTPPGSGSHPIYAAPPPQAAPPPATPPQAASAPPGESAPASGGGESKGASAGAGLVEVHSPMVGTFYRSPAPDAPPYVEVGARVSKGQTLCILEAMKLMNELESEVDGVVRDVLVENSEPVEYGQVLFRIDPNG